MIINGARIRECMKTMSDIEFAMEFDITLEAAHIAREYYYQKNKSLKSCHVIAVAIAKRKKVDKEQ